MKLKTNFFLLISVLLANLNVSAQKAVTPKKFKQPTNLSALGVNSKSVKSLDSVENTIGYCTTEDERRKPSGVVA